jgi:hypothetical protein
VHRARVVIRGWHDWRQASCCMPPAVGRHGRPCPGFLTSREVRGTGCVRHPPHFARAKWRKRSEQSGRGQPQSRRLRHSGRALWFRQVLECGSPVPLFCTPPLVGRCTLFQSHPGSGPEDAQHIAGSVDGYAGGLVEIARVAGHDGVGRNRAGRFQEHGILKILRPASERRGED